MLKFSKSLTVFSTAIAVSLVSSVFAAPQTFASSQTISHTKTHSLGISVNKNLMADVYFGSDTLLPDQYLTPTGANYIRSSNGQYGLFCQADGNLVLYTISNNALTSPSWASHTAGKAVANCYMQADGNFVVNGFNQALWASHTAGHPGAYLRVEDDGYIRIYRPNGSVLWTRPLPIPDDDDCRPTPTRLCP